MKKHVTLVAMAAITVVLFASCGKRCWCYDYPRPGVEPYETETYVDDDVKCFSLNTPTRTCVEDFERMDPGSLANK